MLLFTTAVCRPTAPYRNKKHFKIKDLHVEADNRALSGGTHDLLLSPAFVVLSGRGAALPISRATLAPPQLAGEVRSARQPNNARVTVLLILLWSLLSWTVAAPVRADIRETPHSLVKSKPGAPKTDGKEICVFCHTPVISGGKAPDRPPQWQASIGKDFTFTIYDDIGRLGLDKPSVGSQSIACLSCHDSNQAYTVSKTSADHPFGIPYRGALKNSAYKGDRAGQPDGVDANPHIHAMKLMGMDDFRDVSRGTIENRTVWWVSSAGITARRSRNDLPLYARVDSVSGEELPHIECSSCHDPHSPNDLFLRVTNEGSKLCLTCHEK